MGYHNTRKNKGLSTLLYHSTPFQQASRVQHCKCWSKTPHNKNIVANNNEDKEMILWWRENGHVMVLDNE